MKKLYYKIIMTIFLVAILLFLNKSISNAATAGISATGTDVKVGDSVNINVSVNAIAWNLKVSGSGISDTIVGGNMDEFANKATSKSYKLNTSNPGTYTITLSGDVTDADGTPSNISTSVSVKVSEKSTSTEEQKNETKSENKTEPEDEKETEVQTKPKEPTFTSVNQTVYATSEVNVRSSYSTSSSSVGKLKKGEEVTRIGVGSNGWSKVKYNGATAYISSTYLTTTKPEEKKEEKSTIKALKSLTIEEGTLSPEFEKETTKYEVIIGSDVEKLTIEALAEDEKAKVAISGNEELQFGENIVKVVVTAEDGTARTYTIVAIKEEQAKIKLSTLKIDGVNLTPSFKPDVYEYTTNVESDIEKLDIKAVCDDEETTVEILGNEELVEGENTITIMLKSKDGKQNVTYQIIVKKLAKNANAVQNIANENNNDMQYLFFIGIVVGIILLLIIIILIIRSIKKDKEDDELELNFMDDIKAEGNTLDNNVEFNGQEEINQNKVEYDYNLEDKQEERTNRLYNVENEVDFSEDTNKERRKARGKRKGKHF